MKGHRSARMGDAGRHIKNMVRIGLPEQEVEKGVGGYRSQANLQGKQPRWSKQQVQASQGDHLSPVMGR